jgi:uncharacterized protein (TIGR02246 family)
MEPIMKTHSLLAIACATVIFASGCASLSTAKADKPATAHSGLQVHCQAVNETDIAALFDRWNRSLATLDPDQVTANYAPDGVLLPTVSNIPRTNHAEIRDYFVHFLEKTPQGHIDRRIVKIGCNLALDMGIYTFTFKGGQTVQARYTYVYEYRGGKWLIAHHHSSAMPEK